MKDRKIREYKLPKDSRTFYIHRGHNFWSPFACSLSLTNYIFFKNGVLSNENIKQTL